MIKRLKSITKANRVILILALLNVAVFAVVSTGIKRNAPAATDTIASHNDNNTYFKSGVNVLDWSYTLLRYFRR